jgi:hypothetical protein
MGSSIRKSAVLAMVLALTGALQLAGCAKEDTAVERQKRTVISVAREAFSSDTPVCDLANKSQWLSPGVSLLPDGWPELWSSITTHPMPGTPRTWEVALTFWCSGTLPSGATVRREGTARALVNVDGIAYVKSWSATSSSPLTPFTQLLWMMASILVSSVSVLGALVTTLMYVAAYGEDIITGFIGFVWRLSSIVLLPIASLVVIVAIAYSGFVVFHSVPGVALSVWLAVHAAMAAWNRLQALRGGARRSGADTGIWRRRIALAMLLGFALAGVYVIGATAGSWLCFLVSVLVCGAFGAAWGPLSMRGERHSAIVGGVSGSVAGAVSATQIVTPEWWMLAILVGALIGKEMDRKEQT